MVQTNVVYSNADQGRIYKNLNMNFFTPRTGVLVLGCSYIVKMQCFFYSLLGGRDQTNIYIVMMTKEGSTTNVNFMIPWIGVLMLGHNGLGGGREECWCQRKIIKAGVRVRGVSD